MLLLLLAKHLDVQQPLRLSSSGLASIELIDSLEDRVALRAMKHDIAPSGEREGVLALDVEWIGGCDNDLAIAHREWKDAILSGPPLRNEPGGVFSRRVEVGDRNGGEGHASRLCPRTLRPSSNHYRMDQKSRFASMLNIQRPSRRPRATSIRSKSKNAIVPMPTAG